MTVVTVFGVVLLTLIGGYLAFPWLVPQVARSLAPQYGVEQIVVDAQRPGWSSWSIPQVEFSTASQIVRAGGIGLTYDPVELIAGRLISVDIKRLEVELKPASTTDATTADPLDPGLLAALPMEQLSVEELHFLAPDIPLQMHGTLALGEGQLRFRLEASRSPLNAPVRLTARLDADGKFLARFHASPDKADHALEATGKWSGDSLGIEGTFDLGDYELGLVAALVDVSAWTGQVRGDFELQLDQAFSLQAFASQLQFSVLPVALPDIKPLAMKGSIQWLPEPTVAGWSLAVSLDGTQPRDGTRLRGHLQHDDAMNTVDGSFVMLSDDLESLSRTFGFGSVSGDVSGTFKVRTAASPVLAEAEVDTVIKAAITYDGTTRINTEHLAITHTAAEPLLWQVSAAPIELRQQDEGTTVLWKAPALNATLVAEDPLTFQFASLGDLDWRDGETRMVVKSLGLEGKGRSDKAGVIADIILALQSQSIPLHLQVDDTFDNWRFKGPLNWVVRQPLLVSTLGMKSEYDITGGTFTGHLEGQVKGDVLTTDIQGTFKNGTLSWDDLVFTGFSSSVVAGLRKDGAVYADLREVDLATFDPGVPITDVRTGVSMQGDLVRFSAISGKLLGGTFAVAPFTYDLEGGDASLQVDLTDLDLGAVLALEGEDLYGEGRLHGQIPVTIVDDEITVTDGTVRNAGKGVIRLAASLAQSVNQPGLDFALRALEDFQYETLEADIDYSAKGDLLAAIRLRGRNVLIEKGRPIHYNLNISENLPTLLASLRLQDEVNERVERRVQQGVTR